MDCNNRLVREGSVDGDDGDDGDRKAGNVAADGGPILSRGIAT